MEIIKICPLMILAILLQSCAIPIPGSPETRHFLIIGVGVTAHKTAKDEAATVISSRSLGLTISDMPGVKASLGFASTKMVSVNQNANLLIQVKHKLSNDIEICTNDIEVCDQNTESNNQVKQPM